MVPTQPVPIAKWDAARDVWTRIPPQDMLPCFEPSDVYSETLPTSGMTRAGTAFALPTSAHPMGDSAFSSLLPTPDANMGNGVRMRSQAVIDARSRQIDLNCLPRLLPTPRTSDTNGAGQHGQGGMDLRTAVDTLAAATSDAAESILSRSATGDTTALLPTPTSRDHKGANQRGDDTCLTGALLPTRRATDGTKGGPNQRGSSGDLMLPSAVMLLPTPSVADAMGGHLTRSGDRSGELLLPGVARQIAETRPLLPTPTAMDAKASGGSTPSDVTLTDAVVRTRLGASTNPRFDAGND